MAAVVPVFDALAPGGSARLGTHTYIGPSATGLGQTPAYCMYIYYV